MTSSYKGGWKKYISKEYYDKETQTAELGLRILVNMGVVCKMGFLALLGVVDQLLHSLIRLCESIT